MRDWSVSPKSNLASGSRQVWISLQKSIKDTDATLFVKMEAIEDASHFVPTNKIIFDLHAEAGHIGHIELPMLSRVDMKQKTVGTIGSAKPYVHTYSSAETTITVNQLKDIATAPKVIMTVETSGESVRRTFTQGGLTPIYTFLNCLKTKEGV